jgi:hypothetical protein
MDDADIGGKIVLEFFLTEIIKRYIVNIVHILQYINKMYQLMHLSMTPQICKEYLNDFD